MQFYVRALQKKLADLGLSVATQLTQSNGGVIAFETAGAALRNDAIRSCCHLGWANWKR